MFYHFKMEMIIKVFNKMIKKLGKLEDNLLKKLERDQKEIERIENAIQVHTRLVERAAKVRIKIEELIYY